MVRDVHTSPLSHKHMDVTTEGNCLGLTWFTQSVLAILRALSCASTGLLPWYSLALNCLATLYFLRHCPFQSGYSPCILGSFRDHRNILMLLESSLAWTPAGSLSLHPWVQPVSFDPVNTWLFSAQGWGVHWCLPIGQANRHAALVVQISAAGPRVSVTANLGIAVLQHKCYECIFLVSALLYKGRAACGRNPLWASAVLLCFW